ncbi:tetratricopeptide repeat protein [Acidianus manzaensis]|uniref:Uncharacterized protein n=1 Tax=Acidianus manzaensis TaxID=282676 RepID=A0A1W6JYB0_9CREN|nr:tetratricopeptide repeat protein [Acidianus manzaensis]ARM75301.1 hypothetical protein B6F84_04140 [Acidianus manzaensis]
MSTFGLGNVKIKELNDLIKKDPKDPWPHFMLAEIYSDYDYDNAIKEYDSAISLDPHVVDFHYKKALLLFRLGKFKEAIDCLENASLIDYSNSSMYYYFEGTLYDENKDYTHAIEKYMKALDKDKDNIWIFEAMILDMIQVGFLDKAIEEIDKKILEDKKDVKFLSDLKEKVMRLKSNVNKSA